MPSPPDPFVPSALKVAASLGLALALAGSRPAEGSDAVRPNIVLIMADDMGFSDIGATGSEIATPNLDRLAREGQLWTDFHNNAKCTTTRVSLLTGRYPRRPEPHLTPTTPTVADTLAAAGYHTVHSGKWHLAGRRDLIGDAAPFHPLDRGFAVSYGLLDGCCNFFDPSRPDPDFKGNRVRSFQDGREPVTSFAQGFYTTDAFTDVAVREIRSAAERGQPFFVHLCYTAPHYPLHAPADLIAAYRGRYRKGWESLREERFTRQVASGFFDASIALPDPEPDVPDWDRLSDEERDYFDHLMATYAAMVDQMDRQIGRVLDTLDQTETADRTLVLFLSDNGGCAEKPGGIDLTRTPGVAEGYTAVGPGWASAQNTPYRRYKSWTHEGGIKTPLLARWPGVIAASSQTDATGHIIDLHPTLADAAGTQPLSEPNDVHSHVDGVSLLPAFRGEPLTRRRPLFWEWNRSYGVRDGRWKAIRPKGGDGWKLYDLVADPTETEDLAAIHPDRVGQMSAAWSTWADAMRAESP